MATYSMSLQRAMRTPYPALQALCDRVELVTPPQVTL